MENQQKEKLSKPLLPLILLLMLVILLTVIASNLRPPQKQIPLNQATPIPATPPATINKQPEIKSEDPAQTPLREDTVREAIKKYRLGKIEEAESDFRTILVFDPDNQAALSYLGTIFFSQKKYKEAEMLFLRETKVYPGDPLGFWNLALTQTKLGKFKEAIETMVYLCGISPANKKFLIETARLYAYVGDRENTEKYLQLAKKQGADLSHILEDKSFFPARSKTDR